MPGFGEHCEVSFVEWEGRRQVSIRAGRHHTERVVPPAGEAHAFDVEHFDHRIEVYVSPTGRSVRVWIDGDEIPVPKPKPTRRRAT